jgi:Predicted O-methyltransferase
MDFEQADSYIRGLYEQHERLNRKNFIEQTRLKDFIPVVDDDVARFLKVTLRAVQPKRILEIGTSIGYSATSMALVAKEFGGTITTVEYDETVAEQARQNFIRAGIDSCVDLKIGDAREIIPSLTGPYDLIFLDVDKHLYPALFKDCVRLLRPGGVFLAEDTLFPVLDLEEKWHDLIEPIEEFNQLVTAEPELDSTLLPIGDGVIMAVRR